MIIFPAIDIKDGCCVRLFKGDFGTVEKVAEDPLKTARSFEEKGASWLHMVDLDGAKDAVPRNMGIFLDVARNTSLKVEVGGGIRSMETVEAYLSGGIERVILGSAAVKNPELVRTAVREYGERIAVGIDAKNGMAAVEGWLDASTAHYLELAKAMEAVGVKTIIYTDISKDGTLSGPNLAELDAINQAVSCQIVASGGVAGLNDIYALKKLNLYGVICGKALYKGTLRLEDALRVAEEE